ncbi:MAG: response regulator transcription factor [Eubacteriales bacterium]
MNYKKGITIKLAASILILILALNFEKALGERLYILIGIGIGYLFTTSIRGFLKRRNTHMIISFIIEIIIIFILETLSRYIVNYPIHILYILTLIEGAYLLRTKEFIYLGTTLFILSNYKFVNQIFLSRSYSKIGESIFFILLTFFIVIIMYLIKNIQKEKENTELVYEELKKAYDNLKDEKAEPKINEEEKEKISGLTKREKEICKLIAQGKNNKEISKELYLSEGTVKNHITNIFNKLKLRDRTQLAVYSLKNKIS